MLGVVFHAFLCDRRVTSNVRISSSDVHNPLVARLLSLFRRPTAISSPCRGSTTLSTIGPLKSMSATGAGSSMRSQASPTGSTSRTMRGLSMSSFSAAALGRSTMLAASAAISTWCDAFASFWIVCASSVVHTKSSSPSLRTGLGTICAMPSTRPSLSVSSDGARSRPSTAGLRKRFAGISTTNGGGVRCATRFMRANGWACSPKKCGARPTSEAGASASASIGN